MKPGRNDPCTCGSLLKYKNCCLGKQSTATTEPAATIYEEIFQAEFDLMPKIMQYAYENLGDSFIEDAWDDFNDYANEEGVDSENLLNEPFMPWLLYVWPLNIEYTDAEPSLAAAPEVKTLASVYAENHALSPAEQRFIQAANRQPYRIFEVMSAKEGENLQLRDIFLDQTLEVLPDRVSTLPEQSIILARLARLEEGPHFSVGHFPFRLDKARAPRVEALKKMVQEELKVDTFYLKLLSQIEIKVISGFLELFDEQLSEVDDVDSMLIPESPRT